MSGIRPAISHNLSAIEPANPVNLVFPAVFMAASSARGTFDA